MSIADDAKKLDSILKGCGVDSSVEVFPDMMHLFQLAEGYLEASHDALSKIADQVTGASENSERQTYENKPRLEQSLKAES